MARALRIPFQDGWYHVMNRGTRGERLKAALAGDRRLRQRVETLVRIIGKSEEQTCPFFLTRLRRVDMPFTFKLTIGFEDRISVGQKKSLGDS